MIQSNQNIVTKFLNDTFNETMEINIANIKQNISVPNSLRTFHSYFSFFWYSSLPCYDVKEITAKENGESALLKYCTWKGEKVPCYSIFEKVTTDRGMCCGFNKPEADRIFVQSEYTSTMKKLQNYDENNSFEYKAQYSDWLNIKKKLNSQPGINMGLTVMLDAHTDLLAEFSVSSDFKGFTAAVIPRSDFPLMSQRGFEIKPGHTNIVALTAIKIDADEKIRDLKPDDRKCLFPEENSTMKLHKNYSQANCLFECALKYAQNKLEVCTPWFFPFQDKEFKMCNPLQSKQLIFEMEHSVSLNACECLPDCNQVVYQKSVTNQQFRKCDEKNFGMSQLCNLSRASGLPEPQIWKQAILSQINESKLNTSHIKTNIRYLYPTVLQNNIFINSVREYDAYENDIAILSVFFESPTVMQYTTKQSRTWVDFISAVGGNGGLFIGFSIVTLVEVIYLFLQILYLYLKV